MRIHPMRIFSAGFATALAVIVLSGVTAPVHGQAGATPAVKWTPPRTPDGHPDMQGIWNSVNSFFTPMQRPAALGDKEQVSEEELSKVLTEEAAKKIEGSDRGTGAYGHEWYEYKRGKVPTLAASLIVEPRSGRIPEMTPWAKEKSAFMRAHQTDSYEFIEPGDRCISRGILGMMLPTFYNNGKRIMQTPGYVTIVSEMIHDTRVVPLDGRPHLPSTVRSWTGDPRGRWDRDSLVVETTNFSARDVLRNISVQTEALRTVERFTMVGPDTLMYRVTIEDPKVYTAPWTIEFPFVRDNDYQLFEYACHEGNYAIPNMLKGARAEEGRAASGSR